MIRKLRYYIIFVFGLLLNSNAFSQPCDPATPSFTIDLTGNSDSVWTSPNISREGLCCGAQSPDVCIEFIITLDPGTVGIRLDIVSGAQPTGALFYTVECLNPTAVGDTMCLNGAGPHRITFCKPGANKNVYAITAIGRPGISGPIFVGNGCIDTLMVSGLEESTITWTSYPYNVQYNSYLTCTTGCDTTIVIGDQFAPDSVVYIATGLLIGACDGNVWITDTAVVYFISDKFAHIIPDNPAVCFGGTEATITATISGGFPPYNYLWNTGETTQSINVTAGNYWVTISDITDCPPVSDSVTVTSFTVPISANAGNDFVICADNGIFDLNGSVEMALGGVWSGGNGTYFPSVDSLSITYTPTSAEIAGDSLTFMLLTTGNGGCPPDSDYVTVYFSPGAVANFTYNQVCFGETIVFSNTSSFNSSVNQTWNWDFGDGNTSTDYNASHTYNTSGYFTVTLSMISDGLCYDTISKTIFISPLPNASFTFDKQCLNVPVNFTDNSTISSGNITTWNWDFGNGNTSTNQNPSNIYNAIGGYNVSLTVTSDSGCTNTIINSLSFTNPLVTTILPENPSVCFGMSNAIIYATVTGGVQPYTYLWSNGATTDSIIVGVGTYWVKVQDSSNCITGYDTVVVTEFSSSIQAFAGNDIYVCSDDNLVHLNGSVQAASGGIWTGGEGTFNPSADSLNTIYTPTASEVSAGSITLMLETTGNGSCASDTDYVTAYFSPSINANFTFSNVCEGEPINFSNTSTYNSNVVTNWKWDFGNGNISTDFNSSFSFGNTGFNNVTLTVVSDGICYDTITFPTYTAPNPIADFSFTGHCNNSPVSFSDLSTISSGNITSWSWDFGNGTNSTLQNPSNLYSIAGNYNVSLTIVSDSGCSSSVYKNIDIASIITGSIMPENPSVCYGLSNVVLYATANGGVLPYSYLWSNGSTNDSIIVGVGTYWVEIKDVFSCNTVYDTVTVIEFTTPINANAGNDIYVCSDNNIVQLNGIVEGASGGKWTGGSGTFNPSSESLITTYTPTASEVASGSITFMLETTGNGSCSADTDYVSAFFSPTIIADFEYSKACAGQSITFTNTSTYSNNVTTVWEWNFGNVNISSSFNSNFTFTNSGYHNVILSVISDSMCYDTATYSVYTAPLPDANFNHNGHCLNDPVFFTNLSSINSGELVAWNWNFGDGYNSLLENPSHLYTSSGGYLVSLEAVSDSGCIDTYTSSVEISPDYPVAKFDINPAIAMPGTNIQFNNQSLNAITWTWDFGDSQGVSSIQNPTYQYADTGFYSISLIVTDQYSCTDTTQKIILIQLPPYLPNAFSPNNDGINDILYVTGGPFLSFEFKIYNQWGELIHFSTMQSTGWDGKFNNKPQPMGVYVYTINAVTYTNEKLIESGDVTLIR